MTIGSRPKGHVIHDPRGFGFEHMELMDHNRRTVQVKGYQNLVI